MRPAVLLCFLSPFLSRTTTALRSPQWIDQQRRIVLGRKVAREFDARQSREDVLPSGLNFKDERAGAYRVKEPLPDIDGLWLHPLNIRRLI
jgi:hypothetical protein